MQQSRRGFFGKVSRIGAALLATGAVVGSTAEAKKSSTVAVLSESQTEKLFYIYQEEKVARDVYSTLGELYPDESTFALIQLSEQSHIEAMAGLCDTYGIDISYVNLDAIGQFELPVLQQLYDTCVAQGSLSLVDGLRVGELIELTDLDDLASAEIGMPSDVVKVLENLKAGSENHLDAFRRAIARAEA